MKWRFWQKAYIATLLLFLLALFGGVAGMAIISWNQTLTAESGKIIAQQQALVAKISQGISGIDEGRSWALPALYEAHSNDVAKNNGAFEITNKSGTVFFSLVDMGDDRPELDVAPGSTNWLIRSIDKRTYIVVSSHISDTDDVLTYSQDITDLLDNWRQMIILYIIGCYSISVFFAVVLFFILRRLSRPLERLTRKAQAVASGDYSTRTPVKGNDEIADLSLSFNDMAAAIQNNIQQLENTASEKQRLLDNLSHELRTPLTAIQGYAEYAEQADLAPEQRHIIMGKIKQETMRMKRLADRMLALSSPEHSQLKKELVAINTLMANVKNTVEPLADAKNIVIEWATPANAPSLYGESVLLESLFINLIDNAIKASHTGDKIKTTLTWSEEGCSLSVEDSGNGMTQEQISHLGEEFYRADKARARSTGGVGLGVALCFKIAKLHDAKLTYHSEPNIGTVAKVVFESDSHG